MDENIPKQSEEIHSTSTQTIKTALKDKITSLKDPTAVVRHPTFSDNFELTETKKDEFFCPISKDVLEMPIETACSHYSCADCLTQVLELSDGPPFCPICKTNLTCEMNLRKAPRVFIQLLYQQSVHCKTCKRELQYQQCYNHVSDAPAQPEVAVISTQPAPPQNHQPIAPASQCTIEDAFAELQQGKLSKDVGGSALLLLNS